MEFDTIHLREFGTTQKPGLLQSMGSQRVRRDSATELKNPFRASQVVLVVKKLPTNAGDIEMCVWSLGREDPLEEGTPVFLPGKSHGQRSLMGYIPWSLTGRTRLERLCNSSSRTFLEKNLTNKGFPLSEQTNKQKKNWRGLTFIDPTPVPLPGKSNGRRSLVGCSPWGR